jgi:hypothetical protein
MLAALIPAIGLSAPKNAIAVFRSFAYEAIVLAVVLPPASRCAIHARASSSTVSFPVRSSPVSSQSALAGFVAGAALSAAIAASIDFASEAIFFFWVLGAGVVASARVASAGRPPGSRPLPKRRMPTALTGPQRGRVW